MTRPSASRPPDRSRSGSRSGRRASFELVTWDPSVDRDGALAKSGLLALATTLSLSIGLAAVDAATTTVGWMLVAGAGLASTSPLIRHGMRARRAARKLPVGRLDPRWSESITRAAAEAARLRALADDAADGPVADHLHFLADRADEYVVALHGAAIGHDGAQPADAAGAATAQAQRRLLEADAARIVAELARLARAAESLHQAQLRHETPSPLSDLIEQTQHITEALEAQHAPGPDPAAEPDADR